MEDAEKQDQFDVTFERVCSVPSATNIVDKEQEQFGVAFDQPFSIKEKPKKKKVNVTITVVSVAGLHIQDCSKRKKGFMSMKNSSRYRELSSPPTTPSTTITASFSRKAAKAEKNATPRVASLPVQLRDASASSPDIIHWPEQDEPSTSYRFHQEWLQEEQGYNTNANKGVSEPCTVHLAITTSSGRMLNLGRAEVLADKVGESFIDIPVIDDIASTGKPTRFGKGKKVKMMKLNGDSLKCGIECDAALRVKIHVSEPFSDIPETAAAATPSFLQHAVPPSRLRSPVRVGSIRKSASTSTDATSKLSNESSQLATTSKMSNESCQSSLDRGVEISYNATQYIPSQKLDQATVSLQVAGSLSEANVEEDDNCSTSTGSYASSNGDLISSLGEDNIFFEYDSRLTWRHLFMCNFPVCGVVKQECADMLQSSSLSMNTTYDEDEPTLLSRGSSYVPW